MLRARSIFRFLFFFIVFVSFLPVIWLALPCPTNGIDHIAYPTRLLKEGKPLLRVYETEAFFPNYVTSEGIALPNYRSPIDSSFFALEATIHPESVQINNATISLKHMPAHPEKASHATVIFVEAPVAEGDGIVLPWWPIADRALLQWEIEKQNCTLPLRISHVLDDLKHVFDVFPDHTAKPLGSIEGPGYVDQPLLRLTWDESEGVDEEAKVQASVPGGPVDDSPSHTYAFRLKMLSLMAPSIMHLTATYGDIMVLVFSWVAWFFKNAIIGFYVGGLILSLVWLIAGRPAIERMLRPCNRVLRLRALDNAIGRLEHVRSTRGDDKGDVQIVLLFKALIGSSTAVGPISLDTDDKLDVEKGLRSD